MNESYLTYYIIFNSVACFALALWIYNVHLFLADIANDQRLTVEGMKYLEEQINILHDSLEGIVLDGDVYLKDGEIVQIDTIESVIYEDQTGKIIGNINKT